MIILNVTDQRKITEMFNSFSNYTYKQSNYFNYYHSMRYRNGFSVVNI